jgi:hypothetical protein
MKKLNLESLSKDETFCMSLFRNMLDLDSNEFPNREIKFVFGRKVLMLYSDNFGWVAIYEDSSFEIGGTSKPLTERNKNDIEIMFSYYQYDEEENSNHAQFRYFLQYEKDEPKLVSKEEFEFVLKLFKLNPLTCVAFSNAPISGWIEEKCLVKEWKWVKV